MSEPLLMTVEKAAERLGVGRDTAYKLVRSGKLGSVMIGTKQRRVPTTAIDEYIRNEMTNGG